MVQNYRMIDVGSKEVSRRRALARGTIRLSPATMQMIAQGDSPKGNILAIAEVAGIMAAKNTSNLLPLCHPLILDSVRIWFEIEATEVRANCEVICNAKTGVEMEALTGLNICLLTIYDLAKAVDPVIEVTNIFLQEKEGGKSGLWSHPQSNRQTNAQSSALTSALTSAQTNQIKVAPSSVDSSFQDIKFSVGTLSDRASLGLYQDESGSLLRKFCTDRSGREEFYRIIPDESEALCRLVSESTEKKIDVLLLTGGTGISKRDITPETIKGLSSKELIGFGELQRQFGSQFTKAAWLSRSSAYVVKDTLVVLFPGSPKAVRQGMDCVGALIPHAVRMIRGESRH